MNSQWTVTYLWFLIQVCFSVAAHTAPCLVLPISLSLSDKKRTFFLQWPCTVTVTYDFDLQTCHRLGKDKTSCHISKSEVILFESYHPDRQTDIQTDTHLTDCSTWLLKWLVKIWCAATTLIHQSQWTSKIIIYGITQNVANFLGVLTSSWIQIYNNSNNHETFMSMTAVLLCMTAHARDLFQLFMHLSILKSLRSDCINSA